MPQAVPALVAFFSTAIGKFALYVIINVGLSYVSQALAGKRSKDAAMVRDGREVTLTGTMQPRQMVYGEWNGPFYGI